MRVLQYYNWGYFEPITSGADVIASNQLEYFRRRGWEVDVLLQPTAGDSFDFIFVGSSAPANVDGLRFFYYRVFVPFLRKHNVRVAVVGKVCEQLDFHDSCVTKLGNVPGDLRSYYERSKVVIIPILEGSGLSIKTIECLASGRAVVTSPSGARGLRPDPDAFIQSDMADDPAGTARTILALLESEPKRKACNARQRTTIERILAPNGTSIRWTASRSLWECFPRSLRPRKECDDPKRSAEDRTRR